MDPYRAELFGIYCVLLCINNICHSFNIAHGLVTTECDCNSTLMQAIRYGHCPTTSHPHFDILWAIFDLRQDTPVKFVVEEVKGHEDSANIGRGLTHVEMLNCEVDQEAKEFLTYVA